MMRLLPLTLAGFLLSWPPGLRGQDLLEEDPGAGGAEDLDLEAELEGRGLAPLRGPERAAALRRIFARPRPEQKPDLCQVLRADLDSRETEDRALEILEQLGGEDLLPSAQALLQHAMPYKQLMGVRLLCASRSPRALPSLLQVARTLAPEHAVVRYYLSGALADLGDPQALPALKDLAETDRFARLALATLGDFARLTRILQDYQDVRNELRELLHALEVYSANWKARDWQEAHAQAARYRDFLRRFSALLPTFGPEQIAGLVAHLKSCPGSSLTDALYAQLADLLSPTNAAAFLALLEVPVPELQAETAWALVDLGLEPLTDQVRAVIRAKARSHSFQDRALAMRLVSLLPAEDRRALLALGLQDSTRYVVTEALKTISEQRIGGLTSPLQELRDRRKRAQDPALEMLLCDALACQE